MNSPLVPMLRTPLELPASVVIAAVDGVIADISSVAFTVTRLELAMLPKPESASAPAATVVAPV